MGYSMRTENYRYTEWRNYADNKVIARELYDHAADPNETENIADDPNTATTIAELANRLATHQPPQ